MSAKGISSGPQKILKYIDGKERLVYCTKIDYTKFRFLSKNNYKWKLEITVMNYNSIH